MQQKEDKKEALFPFADSISVLERQARHLVLKLSPQFRSAALPGQYDRHPCLADEGGGGL